MIYALILTDGTTTATLTDASNYMIASNSFTLGIAQLNPGELGGAGPLAMVDGAIAVDVFSTPANLATTLTNLERLQQLAMQVQRWRKGWSVPAVLLKVQMGNGVAPFYQCVLEDLSVEPPSDLADTLVIQEVTQVRLSFTRRGAWLPVSGTSVQTANVTQPAVQQVDFSSAAAFGTMLQLQSSNYSVSGYGLGDGFVIAAPAIVINTTVLPSVYMEKPTTGTSTSDSTAWGGSVMRFGSGSNEISMGILTSLPPGRISFFAVCRKTAAADVWSLKGNVYGTSGAGGLFAQSTALSYLDTSSTSPRAIFLGSITSMAWTTDTSVTIANVGTVTGSIDIDYFVAVVDNVNFEYYGAFYGYGSQAMIVGVGAEYGATSITQAVTVSSNPFGRSAYVKVVGASDNFSYPVSYRGDPAIYGQDRYWYVLPVVVWNTSYGLNRTYRWTMTRWPASLTPQ